MPVLAAEGAVLQNLAADERQFANLALFVHRQVQQSPLQKNSLKSLHDRQCKKTEKRADAVACAEKTTFRANIEISLGPLFQKKDCPGHGRPQFVV